jgi:MoaA/NifB/PqqE/SkfB family radical SAM enzyme
MNKETFCSLPFSEVFLGSDGGIRPCCSLRGELGDINKSSLEDILNGDIATSIRKSIIDGKWHSMCSQCEELEPKGARTERTHTVHFMDKFKNASKNDFVLENLDLRWSNTCNLSCNYCYEYFSSKWAEIKGIKVNANKETAEEKIFTFIENQVNQHNKLLQVRLLGGEPLLQKQNVRLLNTIKNNSKIYILTNLTVPLETNKVAQLLLENNNVTWGVSFETVNKRFEYVREGGKWDQLLSNLRLLHSKNKTIDSHPLYCLYSAFNLVEYYDFLDSEGCFSTQYWQVLQNIQGLDVFLLPNKLKIKALDELERCFVKYEHKFDMSLLKSINQSLIDSLSKDSNNTDKCLNWLDELDKFIPAKKESFIELWPELYQDFITK